MRAVLEGFKLLEYDYLGGHGTRGYGKVRFTGVSAVPVFGDMSEKAADIFNTLAEETDNVL